MIDEEIDLLRLRLIREGKERSGALPQQYYGDPAKCIKFESEKRLAKVDTVPKKGKR